MWTRGRVHHHLKGLHSPSDPLNKSPWGNRWGLARHKLTHTYCPVQHFDSVQPLHKKMRHIILIEFISQYFNHKVSYLLFRSRTTKWLYFYFEVSPGKSTHYKSKTKIELIYRFSWDVKRQMSLKRKLEGHFSNDWSNLIHSCVYLTINLLAQLCLTCISRYVVCMLDSLMIIEVWMKDRRIAQYCSHIIKFASRFHQIRNYSAGYGYPVCWYNSCTIKAVSYGFLFPFLLTTDATSSHTIPIGTFNAETISIANIHNCDTTLDASSFNSQYFFPIIIFTHTTWSHLKSFVFRIQKTLK